MPASKTYIRYAMKCLAEACKTSNQKQKAFFIEMAGECQRLGQQATGIEGGRRADTSNLAPDQGD